MKLKISAVIVLTALLTLPAVAPAQSMLLDRVGNADCDGWYAEVTIQWRDGIYSGDFDYVVQLLDMDNNVLEEQTWVGVLERTMDDPEIMTYEFSGLWEGEFPGPMFVASGTFNLVAPYPEGVDQTTVSFTHEFECTVSAEATTFSQIKSIYE